MILVITGFGYHPFDRLILAMDDIASRIDEKVVIQKGASSTNVRNAISFNWGCHDLIMKYINEARLIICHAGIGILLDCKKAGKNVIIVPRKKEFGEITGNHQLEITDTLKKRGTINIVEEIENLEQLINNNIVYEKIFIDDNKSLLLKALKDILIGLEKEH